MADELIIFGATSLARITHHYATAALRLNVKAFVVDDGYLDQIVSLPADVVSWSEALRKFPPGGINMHVAIGYKSIKARETLFRRIVEAGYQTVSIVAPGSHVSSSAKIADNCLILPGAVIEPGVSIGINNVIWSNSTICHDTRIGDHNFIAANVTIGGNVKIGSRNFFGFSAVVLQGRTVENDVLVGASALVTGNLRSCTHCHGCPAREIKRINPSVGVCVRDETCAES